MTHQSPSFSSNQGSSCFLGMSLSSRQWDEMALVLCGIVL